MRKNLYEDLFLLEDKHWWHVSKRNTVIRLIEKYKRKDQTTLLDIGCGAGRNIKELQKFGTAYGLDNSAEAIKFCKKRGLKNLILGSAEKTNLKSNSFDVITLLDVIEHTDDNKTLKETHRILKKYGLVIITVPAFQWLWSQWDVILHHKRRYTIKNMKSILKENDFDVMKASYMYSFLVIPVLIIRSIKSIFSKNDYTSDFRLSSPFINFILGKISFMESFFVINKSIPFGTSIIIVAQKNK